MLVDRPGVLADRMASPDPAKEHTCVPVAEWIAEEQTTTTGQLVEELNRKVILDVVGRQVIDVVVLGGHVVVAPGHAAFVPVDAAVDLDDDGSLKLTVVIDRKPDVAPWFTNRRGQRFSRPLAPRHVDEPAAACQVHGVVKRLAYGLECPLQRRVIRRGDDQLWTF